MDERILSSNEHQSPPYPDDDNGALDLFFAIPAPVGGLSQTEDFARMFAHSRLTQRFVAGQISPADYADGLADLGHDPNLLADLWEKGIRLL